MRILGAVLAASILLAPAAIAQQGQLSREIHCKADATGQDQDYVHSELRCLDQLRGLASRAGESLRIVLENGNTTTFKDESLACKRHIVEKCITYKLVASYPAQRLFVIERFAYESFDFIVVMRKNGSITKIDERPHLSPNGTRLVVATSSEAWEIERNIVIYSVQTDALKPEWSYKAKVYEMWAFDAWDGIDRIKLNVSLWKVNSAGARAFVKQAADLQRINGNWQLTKDRGVQ